MIKYFFVFIVISVSLRLQAASEIKSVQKNNEGVYHLEREDVAAAEQNFIQSLVEDPFNPILHLNLGWTFEMQKKFDKAQKEYEAVLRVSNLPDDLKFVAHFNAGNAAAQNKNIEAALKHYQAALDLRPDSQEVRTNIELLFKGGGGKGKGDSSGGQGDDQKEQQDGQGQKPDQSDQKPNEGEKKGKPQFKSENLTKEDVRKILEELKSQEAKIRALEYGTKGKESTPGKDW